jgi:hypothetical protein
MFYVTAVGPPGSILSYAWYQNGTLLTDGGRVSGSTSATLQIANLAKSDAGQYTVDVSCACGHTESFSATLTLDPKLQLFTASNAATLIWGAPNLLLQQADNPAGPWTTIQGATSPFDIAALGPAKFFRLVQTPP